MTVGIERMGVYCGAAFIDVAKLAVERGLDPTRFANLLMRRRQETSWLLQALGAVAPESAYNARGGRGDTPLNRHLAEA